MPAVPPPSRKLKFLDSARRLVQAHGFAATSLDALCEDAGATKGAFFHYFRDKNALGIELLDHFRAAGRSALAASAHAAEPDPRRRLRRYLAHLADMYETDPRFRDGCLFAIFAYENADPRSRVRQLCAAAIGEWLDDAGRELKRILSAASVRPAVRTGELAELLLAAIEGALILNRTGTGRGAMRRVLAHFGRYVELLMDAQASPIDRPRARR
jgi:TetR/AcrR family transcriptional repressor of nem operon